MSVAWIVEEQVSPELDAVVQRLNHLYQRGGLDAAVAVGACLLELFHGDADAATISYRRLSVHPGLEVSVPYLSRALHIAVQHGQLPVEIRDRLSLSHHRELLVIKSPVEKRLLAQRTVERGWTVDELKEQIRELRPIKARERRSGGARAADELRRAVESLGQQSAALVGQLGIEGALELVEDLERQVEVIRELRRALMSQIEVRRRPIPTGRAGKHAGG